MLRPCWTGLPCPMQQAVRIEGVVHPTAPIGVKSKTNLFSALADHVSDLRLFFWGGSVLFRQVFAQILAPRAHLGIEFERLKTQFNRYLAFQAFQGLLQSAQTHGAPWAGNVGYEINGQWSGHGSTVVGLKV